MNLSYTCINTISHWDSYPSPVNDTLDLIGAKIIFKNTQTMLLIKWRLNQAKDFFLDALMHPLQNCNLSGQ